MSTGKQLPQLNLQQHCCMDFKSHMSFSTSMLQAMHTAHMVPFSTLNNMSNMIPYVEPIILRYPVSESPRYLRM
jgi:hypothetical protein